MASITCPPGKYWDFLVSTCVRKGTEPRPDPGPSTEPPRADGIQLRATTSNAQSNILMVLSPVLWIVVVLAILGSILALVLWFIIYRRKSSSTPEDAEKQQDPKAEPSSKIYRLPPETNGHAEMSQRAAGAPSPCPHLYTGPQASFKWEEGFIACRDHPKHAGTEGGGGMSACSIMKEHRVPLPAIELGGTALVTTKM